MVPASARGFPNSGPSANSTPSYAGRGVVRSRPAAPSSQAAPSSRLQRCAAARAVCEHLCHLNSMVFLVAGVKLERMSKWNTRPVLEIFAGFGDQHASYGSMKGLAEILFVHFFGVVCFSSGSCQDPTAAPACAPGEGGLRPAPPATPAPSFSPPPRSARPPPRQRSTRPLARPRLARQQPQLSSCPQPEPSSWQS